MDNRLSKIFQFKPLTAKIFGVVIFVLLFGAYMKTFAIGSPYSAGATLDPACAPGEVNCIVEITSSPWTTSGSDIYFTGGNVGIGTNTPTASLTAKGSVATTGLELITNGTFTGSASGWNLIYDTAYDNNNVTMTAASNWGGGAATNVSLVSGQTYILTFTLSDVVKENVYIYFDNDSYNSNIYYGEGIHSLIFTADYTGTDTIYFESYYWNGPGSTWTLDDISMKVMVGSTVDPSFKVVDFAGRNIMSIGNEINSISLGNNAGVSATSAINSNFIGNYSGYGATDANYGNFIGDSAGYGATSAENSNFIGYSSGALATNSNFSNFLGYHAGYNAVSASGSNFLGIHTGDSATNANSSNFLGDYAGYQASSADHSNFLGYHAGYQATNSRYANFLGYYAGKGASSSRDSNFLGYYAGYNATNAPYSNFFGSRSGQEATNALYSNFIGIYAGYQATNSGYSNFIGANSGYRASNATQATFVGYRSGYNATNTSYSSFLGSQSGESATNGANSIFIGNKAGLSDTVNNTDVYNDTTTFANTSILIGHKTNTGGFSNSIALGAYAVNTATNQFMIGSTTRPINTTRFQGATTECTITTGTGIACTSDERRKTNIVDLNTDTLNKLIQIRTVNFNWLEGDSSKNNIGFIAQDLEQYFPELVSTDIDGYKSVYYANMTPVIVESIRELNLKLGVLSSLDTSIESSLGSLIKRFLENGLVFIKELKTGLLRIDGNVCVDDVCITKEQFKQMLINNSTPSVEPLLIIEDGAGGGEEAPALAPEVPEELPPSAPLPEEIPLAPEPTTEPTPSEENPILVEEGAGGGDEVVAPASEEPSAPESE